MKGIEVVEDRVFTNLLMAVIPARGDSLLQRSFRKFAKLRYSFKVASIVAGYLLVPRNLHQTMYLLVF